MRECGPKVAALTARLREFADLSARLKKARLTEGAALRELRGMFGLTQDDAVPLLGISKPYLSLLETGNARLTPEIAERAADLAERLERCKPANGLTLAEVAQQAAD